MPTAHYTTRHDTTRQLPTKKSCNVRGSTTGRDTTRQKSDLVVRDLTMLDICDITRFCCRGRLVVTRRLMCGGHKIPT